MSTRCWSRCRTTFLVLFFDSLAAFAFAKFDFPGKQLLFGLLMVIFMVPAQLSVIPQFVIMVKIGWIGHADRADRAGRRQRVRHLLDAPVHQAPSPTNCSTPPASTARIPPPVLARGAARGPARSGLPRHLHLHGPWNDYAWPLIALTNPDNVTLQVALSQLNGTHGTTDYGMVMTGALLALVPLLIVFALGARQIIGDLAKGAVRG